MSNRAKRAIERARGPRLILAEDALRPAGLTGRARRRARREARREIARGRARPISSADIPPGSVLSERTRQLIESGSVLLAGRPGRDYPLPPRGWRARLWAWWDERMRRQGLR